MGSKHRLKEPHPCFTWRGDTNTGGVQSKPQRYVENMNTFILLLIKSDTVQLISHMVYTVVHRGYVLQSEAIGNNGSEESDVTTDCPLCNNVSFNRPVSSWRWDNRSTVPVPPDRLWPPTAASVHSQGHMGGMWPSKAHVDQLNEGIMRHGGRAIHA